MSFISKLFGKKDEQSPIISILPEEIYQAGVLELKDMKFQMESKRQMAA